MKFLSLAFVLGLVALASATPVNTNCCVIDGKCVQQGFCHNDGGRELPSYLSI